MMADRDVAITGVTVNHDKNVYDNNYRFHFKYHYYHPSSELPEVAAQAHCAAYNMRAN